MLPSLTRRAVTTPFDALWDVRRQMDRLFNGYTGAVDTPTSAGLPAEVSETANEFRFMIDLPGVKPDHIDLTVENNILSVSGERKFDREEGESGSEYHLVERHYGRFERSFALPRRVDPNGIVANYEDGVLTVVLPKVEEAKARRIRIGTSAKEIEAGK